MNKTRAQTIIVSESVMVTWWNNREYYESRGYTFSGARTRFECLVGDLPNNSNLSVITKCPVCGKEKLTVYQAITRQGHTLCIGCAGTADIIGLKSGRLTVVDLDLERSGEGTGAYWLCQCECGNLKSVSNEALVTGKTISCGCYMRDGMHLRYGQNHWRWNLDLTDEDRRANKIAWRDYPEYDEWRSAVYARDDYTCVCCGKRGGKLRAHHLYSYAEYPEHQLDIENGVTMKKECHAEFHSWMGGNSVPCTPDDFRKWLSVKRCHS